MSWFSLVRGDQLALADHVSFDRVQQFHAVQPWLQIERRIERVHDEMVVMHSARWRRRTPIDRTAESGHALDGAGNLRWHPRVRRARDDLGAPPRCRTDT